MVCPPGPSGPPGRPGTPGLQGNSVLLVTSALYDDPCLEDIVTQSPFISNLTIVI